jgi:hypothetical protein
LSALALAMPPAALAAKAPAAPPPTAALQNNGQEQTDAKKPKDRSVWAELAAAGILILFTVPLLVGRRAVALKELKDAAGNQIAAKGDVLTEQQLGGLTKNTDYRYVRAYRFRTLIIGMDNRWSTSKLQPVLWTYAILFGVLALMLAKAMKNPAGFEALTKMKSDDWDVYLILLGGPFAAFVLAKFSTSAKVDDGTVQKTTADTSTLNPLKGVGEVVSDDSGNGSLGDTQYFAFNLVALAYFLGVLCANLQKGFPDLPSILVGLTSVSAATYVAKKAVEKSTPSLASVVPAKASQNSPVEVWGANLVVPSPSTPPPAGWGPRATIDGLNASVKVLDSGGSADHLEVTVPGVAIPAGQTSLRTKLAVYTAVGALAGTLDFEVV